ncbi:helix-turn-helix domain-containing protein [Prevotella koreensis]|uniref:XRE family transcriptional regulator n=1 Tax=Prevotella koreensis TaxID=2490854 RepID=A0A432LH55_9BACT|nr:helix-turn-helix transcriptional regulator [Prevotella koreensis]RUL58512.1 XRE family transcriptional regulator [Prevotella koreensis]
MKDRIRQIMESQHMTQQTFAQFIGISPAALSSIFNGRTNATLNTVEAIKSKLPALNSDWLLFGKGKMYEGELSGDDDNTTGGQANGEPMLDFGETESTIASYPHQSPIINNAGRQNSASQRQVLKPEVKYVERPQRQITEIRIYFDDLTYETFVPKSK